MLITSVFIGDHAGTQTASTISLPVYREIGGFVVKVLKSETVVATKLTNSLLKEIDAGVTFTHGEAVASGSGPIIQTVAEGNVSKASWADVPLATSYAVTVNGASIASTSSAPEVVVSNIRPGCGFLITVDAMSESGTKLTTSSSVGLMPPAPVKNLHLLGRSDTGVTIGWTRYSSAPQGIATFNAVITNKNTQAVIDTVIDRPPFGTNIATVVGLTTVTPYTLQLVAVSVNGDQSVISEKIEFTTI